MCENFLTHCEKCHYNITTTHSSIDSLQTLWYDHSCSKKINIIILYSLIEFRRRFKAEIQRERAKEERAHALEMSLILNFSALDAEFCLWPTLERIQTRRSCMFVLCSFVRGECSIGEWFLVGEWFLATATYRPPRTGLGQVVFWLMDHSPYLSWTSWWRSEWFYDGASDF